MLSDSLHPAPTSTLKFSLKTFESGQCRFCPNTFFWPLLSTFRQCQDPISLLSWDMLQKDRSQFWMPFMLPDVSCHVLLSLPNSRPPWGKGLPGHLAQVLTVSPTPLPSPGDAVRSLSPSPSEVISRCGQIWTSVGSPGSSLSASLVYHSCF